MTPAPPSAVEEDTEHPVVRVNDSLSSNAQLINSQLEIPGIEKSAAIEALLKKVLKTSQKISYRLSHNLLIRPIPYSNRAFVSAGGARRVRLNASKIATTHRERYGHKYQTSNNRRIK